MVKLDLSLPGAVLERRLVAEGAQGKTEWHRVRNDDGITDHWRPWFTSYVPSKPSYEPVFLPLPGSQWSFLECPIFECLFEGTRGPGKTISLVMDFAKDVGKGYGSSWRGILFRREYKDLDDVVKKIKDIFPKMFNQDGKEHFRFLQSKSEYMALWDSGEALLLRHLEGESDYDNYHGHEYPWLGFEELTQWEDNAAYLKMQSCCRSSKPGLPCRVRSTTNPYGPGHNWVKKRFRLPEMRSRVITDPSGLKRVAVHGTMNENFLLLHATPQYAAQIMQSTKNPAEAKAWLEGDWNVTSGGMIDDLWRADVHIVPNFRVGLIPRGWQITRAYDHGQSHPFACGWWLESNGEPIVYTDKLTGKTYYIGTVRGDLILWMEWYGTSGEPNTGIRLMTSKIARGIVDRERDEGIAGYVLAGPADTEIFNKLSDRGNRCPADDFTDEGIEWERADKSPGSRKRGWEILRTKLQASIPSPDGYREKPGIFVCMRCRHWIDLVPPMPRDVNDMDDVPEKYEDHSADMTRYRLNWGGPSGTFRRSF